MKASDSVQKMNTNMCETTPNGTVGATTYKKAVLFYKPVCYSHIAKHKHLSQYQWISNKLQSYNCIHLISYGSYEASMFHWKKKNYIYINTLE